MLYYFFCFVLFFKPTHTDYNPLGFNQKISLRQSDKLGFSSSEISLNRVYCFYMSQYFSLVKINCFAKRRRRNLGDGKANRAFLMCFHRSSNQVDGAVTLLSFFFLLSQSSQNTCSITSLRLHFREKDRRRGGGGGWGRIVGCSLRVQSL